MRREKTEITERRNKDEIPYCYAMNIPLLCLAWINLDLVWLVSSLLHLHRSSLLGVLFTLLLSWLALYIDHCRLPHSCIAV